MKKNKKVGLVLLVIILLVAGFAGGSLIRSRLIGHRTESEYKYNSNFGKDEYVRSVTYFGESWPINFWNSELETLDSDFKQIKSDGFNSIILVIPWKEFQPSVDPIEYNDYPFEKLDEILNAAEKHDLDVYARVGYLWDFYNDQNENIALRSFDIMCKGQAYTAWLDYCKQLYEALSKHPNYKDSFLTWEDFWGALGVCLGGDEQIRLEHAKVAGYQAWVENKFGLDSYNEEFGYNYSDISSVPFPDRSEPGMKAFYNYFDDFLNGILADTQEVFPNMSMEVRQDADPIVKLDGGSAHYSHEETYSCEDSDYVATMYGIHMGFSNNGERVTAEETLPCTEYILKDLTEKNGGKPVYVEQFLFYDNAQGFDQNAKLQEGEIGKYLESVSGVLANYTRGYALWTYRDYRGSMIYNPQFGIGDAGWEIEGNATVENSSEYNSNVCRLSKGDALTQFIPGVRNHYQNDVYNLEFDVKEANGAKLEISFGNDTKEIQIDSAGNYSLQFNINDSLDLKIRVTDGDIVLDNLNLYSFIQKGLLYDENNERQPLVDSIKKLNKQLSKIG
ncbi:hypothetical protein [Butyrivibrio sp. LC3010]|uniref:hypothetical protein n=1 Tax=Butyrivibrio sp. LC3010 TaxID=1280680 RepID=UPI0004126375|nr:hypothetical protein [Butyrivibrio sp. LC3010]